MLIINRKSGFRDLLRNYQIYVDDINIADIKHGETRYLKVSPGRHTIHLKIDWCRSNTICFDISENEDVEFVCGSSLKGWRFVFVLIYISFLKDSYLWLKQVNSHG